MWLVRSIGCDPVVVLLPESLIAYVVFQWRDEKAGENFRYLLSLGIWPSIYVTVYTRK